MAKVYDLLVKASGDSRDAQRAMRDLQQASQRFNDGFGRHMKSAAKWGALALGAGLAATVKVGMDELAEAAKVGAQTDAVIRSTGKAAGFSRAEFEGLAESLMKVSGVDDEVIQSAENLIATFTRVKGDAFEGATKAALDMSVALGEDMTSSAMRIGKALQDPIKGVVALRRAGVMLTDSQTKQIKAFVESGDIMKAQKIILKELNVEFGGSAKAFGKTGPGQVEKAKRSFEELAASLTAKVMPSLGDLAREAIAVIDSVKRWSETAQGQETLDRIAHAARATGEGLKLVASAGMGAARVLGGMGGALVPMVGALAGAVAGYRIYTTAVDAAKTAQLALNKAMKLNPWGLALGAVIALGSAFAATKLQMSSSEKAIRANERAIKDFHNAALDEQEFALAVQEGNQALIRAQIETRNAAAARKAATKGTDAYRLAVIREKDAILAEERATLAVTRAEQQHNETISRNKKEVKDARKAWTDLNTKLQESTTKFANLSGKGRAAGQNLGVLRERMREANAQFASARERLAQLAGKLDLVSGKALRGGEGFAKMREQMKLLKTQIDKLPTEKQFTYKIVTKYSGVKAGKNGIPQPSFMFPQTYTGGVFTTPQVRSISERGPEAIVPLGNDQEARANRARVMAEAGLSGGGGGITINGPIYVNANNAQEFVRSMDAQQRAYSPRRRVGMR